MVGVLAGVRVPIKIVKAIGGIGRFTAITGQMSVLEAARQTHVEEKARLVEEEEARSEREIRNEREREFEDVVNRKKREVGDTHAEVMGTMRDETKDFVEQTKQQRQFVAGGTFEEIIEVEKQARRKFEFKSERRWLLSQNTPKSICRCIVIPGVVGRFNRLVRGNAKRNPRRQIVQQFLFRMVFEFEGGFMAIGDWGVLGKSVDAT